MKTITNPTTIDEAINGNRQVVIPTIAQHAQDFILNKKTSEKFGANTNDLFNVAIRLINNYSDNRLFNLNDFILAAKYLDLDNFIVTEFFESFVAYLTKAGRIHTILSNESAYEWSSYHFF